MDSAGIDDFDPLKNPNVLDNHSYSKPLPPYQNTLSSNNFPKPIAHPSTSSSLAQRKPAVPNPLLPYFAPKKTMQDRKTDSDLELLRKYGLDSLKLNDNQQRMTATTASDITNAFIPHSNNFNKIDSTDSGLRQTQNNNNKYQWTTFD